MHIAAESNSRREPHVTPVLNIIERQDPPDTDRRRDRGDKQEPASRPDNEVPANRREVPRQPEKDEDRPRRDRRGS